VNWPLAIFVSVLAWLAFALLIAVLRRDRPRGDEITPEALFASLLVFVNRLYMRHAHKCRVDGREHIPERTWGERTPRGLLVVANHTSGLDPLLIQSALPFEPRWVMAEDMRVDSMQWAWDFAKTIFVDRENETGGAVREIVRELGAAHEDGGRLRVLRVESLPEGWFGKHNAMRVGVEAAGGAVLCFIDADCRQTSRCTLFTAVGHAMERSRRSPNGSSDFINGKRAHHRRNR